MDKSLLSEFMVIENSLDRLVDDLSKYPHEILEKRPAPSAWSVLEVLQHLMIAERGSLAYVKKKTSYPGSLEKAGLSGQMGRLKLSIFMNLPIKFKAPTTVGEDQFDKNANFDKLIADWRLLRIEMKDFLEHIPNDWLHKLTYRHAFAGRMTFAGMMLFFRYHLIRHRKQIDRTLAKVNGR